jgi:hypothetical protein
MDLKKFQLKLPEPADSSVESKELQRVLIAAAEVPSIAIQLEVRKNQNVLLHTIAAIVTGNVNRHIRNLTLALGPWVQDFTGIVMLLHAMGGTLSSLKMYRKGKGADPLGASQNFLRLPSMDRLKYLDIATHRIPIVPIQPKQFPNLVGLHLHLKYGNDDFYKKSMLHPLEKLSLRFHETSIMRVQIDESLLDNLISKYLTKLELINPPPGHLTFMCHWGQKIEKLILAAPCAYGDDPTYPIEKVLGQLRGVMQFRDGYYNDLSMLPSKTPLISDVPLPLRFISH